ncbi:retrovirus-related pol polyprotein from transposon TNT 1-94 [Tanacetum coccineum]
MTTLAEFMIIAGADNRLPMLEKSLDDSWKSRMEHYMKNRENGRMILNSVQNGPLIWPTVTDEDGTTRTKKYEEFLLLKRFKLITITKLPISFFKVFHPMSRLLSIIIKLQKRFGTEFAQLINNMNVINMSMRPVQVNTKFLNSLPLEWRGQARVVKCYNCQGEGQMSRQCTQPKRPRNVAWFKEKAMLAEAQETGQILDEDQLAFLVDPGIPDGQAVQTTIPNNIAFQTKDLDAYDSDCDDVSNAKAVLMANLSSYGSDVL